MVVYEEARLEARLEASAPVAFDKTPSEVGDSGHAFALGRPPAELQDEEEVNFHFPLGFGPRSELRHRFLHFCISSLAYSI